MSFLLSYGPDMRKLTEIARQSPKGMDRDNLAAGLIVMISPNLGTGDRSWTSEIWTVIGSSGPHIALKQLKTGGYLRGDPIIVNSLEHEFYDAQEMAAAVAAEVAA